MAKKQAAEKKEILSREEWLLQPGAGAGTAILVHGLNNTADIMKSVGEIFFSKGFHLLFVRLRGHRGEGWEAVDYAREWTDDVRGAVREAAERFPELPIVFAGFSLGATLAAAAGSDQIKAFFLFAPAVRLNPRRKLLRLIAPLRFFGVALPSLAPVRWRANETTSLHAYEGLHRLARNFDPGHFKSPAVAFLDPEDTLVSYARSHRWLEKDGSRIRVVSSSGVASPAHLVVDPTVRGELAWTAMAAEIETIVGGLSSTASTLPIRNN